MTCSLGRSPRAYVHTAWEDIDTVPKWRWRSRGWPATPVTLSFTPHLAPMQRGLVATVTTPLTGTVSRDDVLGILGAFYQGRRFVEVIDRPPQTRWVSGSNRAMVTAAVDEHAGVVIAVAAIDNLLKGAAGQAVQCANLALGLDEGAGLPTAGWMP